MGFYRLDKKEMIPWLDLHKLDCLAAALTQGHSWCIQSYHIEISATSHCVLAICIMTSKETRQEQMVPMAYKSKSHTHSMLLSNESEAIYRLRAKEIKGHGGVMNYFPPTLTVKAVCFNFPLFHVLPSS